MDSPSFARQNRGCQRHLFLPLHRRRSVTLRYVELRNIAATQVPVPAQEVAVAAYTDETHVDNHREIYVAVPSLLQTVELDSWRYGIRVTGGKAAAKS